MFDVESSLKVSPLIAILRGITPEEIIDYSDVIIESGWRCIEIPLNSPDPLESIRRLAKHCGDDVLVGAGTVLSVNDVAAVSNAGGRLIVSPNTNPEIIRAALDCDMVIMPGFLTPTEAFTAYQAGARYLKLFPADTMGPTYIKAIRSVLPVDAKIIPVGGVSPETIAAFHQAGSVAYGIGSQLYKAGMSVAEVRAQAERFFAACNNLANH